MIKSVKVYTNQDEEVDEVRATLRKINNAYNERLREILSGDNKNFKPLELGMPSLTLLECRMPDLPIQMAVKRLVSKKLQSNHPFKLITIVNLPEYLANPIAVFQSKTRCDSKVVLTEMEESGVNIVLAIEKERSLIDREVNDVRSIYPKDNIKDVLRWIAEDGLMEYCNKEKALNWLGKQQSNSAEVARLIESCTNIVHKCE